MNCQNKEKYHYLKSELYSLVKENDNIFEFLQRGSLDGIWYWDLEKPENEWMSARFWETFGVDPLTKQHLSQEWKDMINPEDLQTALKNFHEHCKNPDHPYDQVVRYKHRNGSWVAVRCRGLAIRNSEGKPIRMLGAHTDVTKIQNAEKLAELNRDLILVNQDLSAFAYAASHDLQSPVKSLRGLIEVLEIEFPSFKLDESETFCHIKKTVDRMQDLINSVLALSEGDGQIADKCEVNLNSVLEKSIKNLKREIEDNSAIIEFSDLYTIEGNQTLLIRLFDNLIGNSIKYRKKEEHPVIIVSSKLTESDLVIQFSDNGIGIDEKYLDEIFNFFTKVHPKSEYPGSGLGLAITRKIVKNHGGKIWVESKKGSGSNFYISFPRGGRS